MANVIYPGDDSGLAAFSGPTLLRRPFIATPTAMLATSGAAALGLGDAILLAPLSQGCMLADFEIRVPQLDSNATAAIKYNVGDNVVLAGAVSGLTSGVQTVPTVFGTTFTLTASASTASFAATNGFLTINGLLYGYAALAGSTFTGVTGQVPGVVIPSGSLIQQCGNLAVYGNAVAQGNLAGVVIKPGFNISGAAVATTTARPGAIPNKYAVAANTFPNPATGPQPAVPAQIGPRWFMLSLSAAPGTYSAPTVPITGYIDYYNPGLIA